MYRNQMAGFGFRYTINNKIKWLVNKVVVLWRHHCNVSIRSPCASRNGSLPGTKTSELRLVENSSLYSRPASSALHETGLMWCLYGRGQVYPHRQKIEDLSIPERPARDGVFTRGLHGIDPYYLVGHIYFRKQWSGPVYSQHQSVWYLLGGFWNELCQGAALSLNLLWEDVHRSWIESKMRLYFRLASAFFDV